MRTSLRMVYGSMLLFTILASAYIYLNHCFLYWKEGWAISCFEFYLMLGIMFLAPAGLFFLTIDVVWVLVTLTLKKLKFL